MGLIYKNNGVATPWFSFIFHPSVNNDKCSESDSRNIISWFDHLHLIFGQDFINKINHVSQKVVSFRIYSY